MAQALKACLSEEKSRPLQPEPITKKSSHFGLFILAILSIMIAAGGLSYFLMSEKTVEKPVQSNEESSPREELRPDKDLAKPASLKIESTPVGAQVFLDGSFQGKTPIALQLHFGKYDVRLSMPDYYEWEAQLKLNEEGETPLFVRLIPID